MTCRTLLYILLFISLAVSPVAVSSVEFSIREGHPRIYVTQEMIPELQRRCREEYKTLYQDLLGTSWILDREPGVGYSDMHNMAMPAFLYIVDGEERYAAIVKNYLDALAEHPPHDQYLTPEYVRQASMVYDWIYDTLTQDEKQRYAGALVDMGDYLTTLWRHSDFNNHFVNESVAVIYIGVALYGDGVADEKAEAFLTLAMGITAL